MTSTKPNFSSSSDHPRGWNPHEIQNMDVVVWSYLEEYALEKEELLRAIDNVLSSGTVILGPHVRKFEHDFSAYCLQKHGIGVGSGTDALFLTLKAFDIGEGDEVITVSHTAVPTIAAIAATGAKARFVDIDPLTCLMDTSLLSSALSSKTKAIIPVHLYGQCVNMKEVMEFAGKHNLKVIEDCAQAHGAKCMGHMAGSFADAACFSFYPTKVLGTYGDGGMVVTSNTQLYERIKSLRMYGMRGSYYSYEHGYNSRLDELHSALLLYKFSQLEGYLSKRADIAKRYDEALVNTSLTLPQTASWNTRHAYYIYAVHHPKRDFILEELKKRGILLNVSYSWPVHTMEGFQDLGYGKGDLPHTESICEKVFSLPMYPSLSKDKQEKVIQEIRNILN